ncbi:MAG: LysR family transcriptional regulator [Pseudomonadales bacterium]
MRQVNLRSVDLNLLTVLQALLEEQHVTRAAEKLHMSQSAVSRALQRLRVLFDDPLLVKSAQGYTLSNRALRLATQLPQVLQSVSGLIQAPEFDPMLSRGTLRFTGVDLDAWVDMPKLMSHLMRDAPKLKLEASSAQGDYFKELRKGQTDYVVSGIDIEFDQQDILSCPLGSTQLVAIMGKDNPLSQQPLTFERYLAAKHGYVAITGKGTTFTDSFLQTMGFSRDVVLKVSDFKSVIDYCEKTDVLFMLPLQLIAANAVGRRVVIKELPDEMYKPEIEFRLFWHARIDNDPLHLWVKERVLDAVFDSN